MCGRYLIATEQEIVEIREILEQINSKYGDASNLKTGEIFPTNTAPVLTGDSKGIWAQPMTWGFPHFRGSGVIINAKAETAAEKNMFRSSLFTRRCVVPSTGFYEWRRTEEKKPKEKFLIRFPDTPILYMAGIYNLFRQPDGSETPCFVILTTEACGSVSTIHSRMPVILTPGERQLWAGDPSSVDGILKRAGPELLLERVS